MGTIHGGILCDLGDAALSTVYMSTVNRDESFTTVDLTVNYLRPVWSGRLEAVGRVVHKGRTVGLVECDITAEEETLVARLSGTCMSLQNGSADRTVPARPERDTHDSRVSNSAREQARIFQLLLNECGREIHSLTINTIQVGEHQLMLYQHELMIWGSHR